MLFLLQQCQELILTLLKKLFKKNLSIFIDVFYPSGEPISQHRLRCRSLAVVHYSFMSHLPRPIRKFIFPLRSKTAHVCAIIVYRVKLDGSYTV